jgi:hypothetical protein
MVDFKVYKAAGLKVLKCVLSGPLKRHANESGGYFSFTGPLKFIVMGICFACTINVTYFHVSNFIEHWILISVIGNIATSHRMNVPPSSLADRTRMVPHFFQESIIPKDGIQKN